MKPSINYGQRKHLSPLVHGSTAMVLDYPSLKLPDRLYFGTRSIAPDN